jgi:hypothetical protein
MGYINVLGSIIFSILSYIVLIEKSHLYLSVLNFYLFMIFSSLIYLTTQVSGILFRNKDYQKGFFFDLVFSMIPLLIITISFNNEINPKSYIADFRWVYLITILIDILFFIPICYKFSHLRTKIES